MIRAPLPGGVAMRRIAASLLSAVCGAALLALVVAGTILLFSALYVLVAGSSV